MGVNPCCTEHPLSLPSHQHIRYGGKSYDRHCVGSAGCYEEIAVQRITLAAAVGGNLAGFLTRTCVALRSSPLLHLWECRRGDLSGAG
jgi:hypothetical protein